MTEKELINLILNSQLPSGAFPSIAYVSEENFVDENSFTTALVISILSEFNEDTQIHNACKRGVDYLLNCENPKGSGMFGFYPVNLQPKWIPEFLPPDTDDTALCSLALFHNGYWKRDQLKHQINKVLKPYQLNQRVSGMEWFKVGMYPTWLDRKRMNNPIDICVNINVATLIKEAQIINQNTDKIFEMVSCSFNWVGNDQKRMQQIMPFYPDPIELYYSLQRAREAGLSEANKALIDMKLLPWRMSSNFNTPICCSIGGGVIWKSPILQKARHLKALKKGIGLFFNPQNDMCF
ncbi:hypothetical protein EPI11_18210 [Flavobacterium cerinum]|uniref:Prenyltransferase n=2 Tax=Flavobacterium cerinum TaxID=2502784 RepID=A0A444GL31_9FLAO|nr:hypothetical protein EPI11_18210 [Flavobacterium cerinum]